jgi:hypothetical protein
VLLVWYITHTPQELGLKFQRVCFEYRFDAHVFFDEMYVRLTAPYTRRPPEDEAQRCM